MKEEICNDICVLAQEEPFKCNNCKDTNLLKSDFSSLQSMFNNLLADYSKSQRLLDEIPKNKESMKVRISCNFFFYLYSQRQHTFKRSYDS